MAEFVNTIDLLGDEFVAGKIVDKTITELNDDTVTNIGEFAFHQCSKLTSIDLPNVLSISRKCLDTCAALTSVNLTSVTSIPENAFSYSRALATVNIPNATSIGSNAFTECRAMQSIDLPKVTKISVQAFNNCMVLKTLILRSGTVCVLDNINVFHNAPISKIYVPQALITQYQNATNWSSLYAAGTCNFVAIEGSEYE